ncbi:MAG: stage III sporulation protein AE [Bacillota bacterium]
MKNFLLALVVLLGFLLYTPPAVAEPVQSPASTNVDEQLSNLDVKELESFIRQVDAEVGEYLPDLSLSKIVADLRSGEADLSTKNLLEGIFRYFFRELLANSSLLGKLVILAVVCAILQNLQGAFDRSGTGKMAYAVAYLALVIIALSSFTLAINTGRQAITSMVDFVHALLPVLLTLMAAVGGFTSAAILHPVVVASVSILSTLIRNVVFPLIYFGAVLGLVSQFSDRFQVSRLAGLMKQFSMGLLGLFITIFIGVLSIQGVAGSVADGVALRTAKFLAGSFVPVVGGMFADAVEAVVGTSLLLKNAVSLVGVIMIFALTIFPALKILSAVMVFKIAGALVQPFGDNQISDALELMGNSLLLVFGAVAAVGLMFFIVISIIVGLGNMTVMLRG